MAVICLVWWGPLIFGLLAIKRWGWPPEFSEYERYALQLLFFFGWSIFIIRTLVHRVIEPYFQVQSLQNPHHHLFRPRPAYYGSFREWIQWTFKCEETEPPQTRPTGRKSRSRGPTYHTHP